MTDEHASSDEDDDKTDVIARCKFASLFSLFTYWLYKQMSWVMNYM